MEDRSGEQILVPGVDASFDEIGRFALTFNAYERLGGLDVVAEIGDDVRRRFEQTGHLPADLETLRTALFFEQRRFRHFGVAPEGADLSYFRELVAEIGRLCGGVLDGPPDD